MVAFTFDDGPDYWTRFILDVIDGTEDKLTFFVTYQAKSWLDGTIYEDSLRRAHSLGCEIGIHSKNYAYVYTASTGTDASAEVLQTELYDFAEIIAGITGEKPKIFRPVGGSFNTQKDYGYPAILWSVDSKDWIISAKYWDEGLKNHQIQDRNEEVRKVVEKATKELVDNVVSTVKSGDIVLMHDVHFLSKNAFPEIYQTVEGTGLSVRHRQRIAEYRPDRTKRMLFLQHLRIRKGRYALSPHRYRHRVGTVCRQAQQSVLNLQMFFTAFCCGYRLGDTPLFSVP